MTTVVCGFFVCDNVSAYTLSLSTSENVTVDVSAAGDGASVGTDNVVVESTCPFGYTLTISGNSDNTLYKNGDSNSSSLISASAGTTVNPLPILGDDGNNNSYVGTWGYTLENNATINSNFIGLTGSTNTLFTKEVASATGGDTIPVHYGVSVDKSIESGAYYMANNGAVNYSVVNSIYCSPIDIIYNDNGANSATTMIGVSHMNVSLGDEITLYASNYKRAGYGFAGWSIDQIDPNANNAATLINNAINSEIVYGPNATIEVDSTMISRAVMINDRLTVILYALWVKPEAGATLQNWTCPNNGTMPIGSVVALTDTRDNDVYAVTKLADGNCWMMENLRLDYDANITTSNTQSYNGSFGGVFAGLAQPETANFDRNSTTANSLYYSGTQSGTATIDIGTNYYPAYRMPRYNNSNTSDTVANMEGADENIYSYGNYYTWTAAAANTSPPTTSTSTPSTSSISICPSGWQLPEGGNNVGFSYLDIQLGGVGDSSESPESDPLGATMSRVWRSYPNNFLYAGDYDYDSAEDRGSWGSYWSSKHSYDNSGSAYRLRVKELALIPAASQSGEWSHTISGNTYYGFSVRCLMKTNYTISFNANGGSGTMNDQSISSGQFDNLRNNTFTAPAAGSSYQNINGDTFPGDAYTTWTFKGWNTEVDGSGISFKNAQEIDNSFYNLITSANSTIVLYAQWVGNDSMYVNFDANGYAYSDSSTNNVMTYHNGCTDYYASSTPSYSHTANIDDYGTTINATYDNSLSTRDIVTVPGADYLRVTITYDVESRYDYLYVFQGRYAGSVTSNMSAGQLATYSSGDGASTTVTIDIPGDTATFAFYSDSNKAYWGYYAVITGLYEEEPASYSGTTQICSRSLIAGTYKTPVVDNPRYLFRGWSEDSTATTATYTSASSVLNNLPGDNKQTITLYAVYNEAWILSFVNTATNTTRIKSVLKGSSSTVAPSSAFSRTNYRLKGWDTNSAGTNVVYNNNQSITPSSDMTFYTVWTPTYTIDYNINTTDSSASGNMNQTHTSIAEGDSVTLYASNYSRAGYGFAGWSFDSSAQPGGSATIYGPNETITAPAPSTAGETKTLYAVWVASAGNLQNWNRCRYMSIGNVTALTDTRDNNTYAVAKLADGKCWMIENLRLDSTADFTESLSQGFGKSTTYGNFIGLPKSQTSYFSNSTTASSIYYSGTQSGTASVDIGTTDDPGYRMPRLRNTNTSSRASSPTNGSVGLYSYGNYYTWSAALANTIYYDSVTATDANGKTSETVKTSICPAGWMLPYGGDTGNGNTAGGYYYLNYKLNSDSNTTDSTASKKLRAYPNNFVYSGYTGSSSINSRGNSGYYWTSTAYSANTAYGLDLYSTSVKPGTDDTPGKYEGQAVRCVLSR